MAPADPVEDTQEYPCLVRVTNGKEVNFSTRVSDSPPRLGHSPSSETLYMSWCRSRQVSWRRSTHSMVRC